MNLVICLSGITGAGKTTLSLMMFQFLIDPNNVHLFNSYRINKVELIHQDNHGLPPDHQNHTFIPGTNQNNHEVLNSLDMNKMMEDVDQIIAGSKSTPLEVPDNLLNILIIEGFLIYNDPEINEMCDYRFHLNLSFDEALKRRQTRTDRIFRDTTETEFTQVIWSYYQLNFNDLPNRNQLIYLNGELKTTINRDSVIKTIKENVKNIGN